MNWWLVIVAIAVSILTLGLVCYMVILYQHEEDRNQAWLPKIIVVFGLCLACFNVLLLPYDIANRRSTDVQNSVGGGINTVLCWEIVMYCIAVMTVVIVPFAIFFYEGEDPDQKNVCNQLKPAICYTSITTILFVVLLVIMWITVGDAEIDYTAYTNVGLPNQLVDAPIPIISYATQRSGGKTLSIKVSPFVYMCGLLSAFGWILFFVFGGIGLAALPMDLISEFKNRPQPITLAEYNARKENIGRETMAMINESKQLEEAEQQGKTGRKHRKRMLAFKAKVVALEDAYQKLSLSFDNNSELKVLPLYLGLFMGIIGVMLSIMWELQILIHNILNASPLLSSMFLALDSGFTLFGVVAYGIFAFYLLWCVVKGCTKMGLNLLIFTVHPMKIHGTMMNSFLFNTLLILIASVSCVQFCAMSFNDYATNTAVDALYMTYVSRLKGINYVNAYMQYPMGAIAILSFFWLAFCPTCKKDDEEDDD